MTRPTDGCLNHAGRPKAASGMTIYLMEELGDARLNCAKLTRSLDEARQLVEKSSHRDHIFEIAGHLLHSIPELTFKLEKSLQAVALAADRLDYEEIKQDLKPEKVEELERVLKDVRIRNVQHRSGGPMNPQLAAESLRKIASTIREGGQLPIADILDLVAKLEGQDRTASEVTATADVLDQMAQSLLTPSKEAPKRKHLAASLKKLLVEDSIASDFGKTAYTVPANATALAEEIRSSAVQAVRSAGSGRWKFALLTYMGMVERVAELAEALGSTDASAKADLFNRGLRQTMQTLHGQPEVQEEMAVLAMDRSDLPRQRQVVIRKLAKLLAEEVSFGVVTPTEDRAILAAVSKILGIRYASDDEKESRFEEGKPADPTENMSPEDAKKWKEEHEKNKDKFKTADYHVQPAKLFKEMGDAVSSLLDARVQTRQVGDMLSSVFNDATGVVWTDNYQNPEIKKVRDDLYQLDHAIGDSFRGIERLERDMKRMTLKSASVDWKVGSDDEKESRFEEGKPADPTENMSPEDAKKWKAENEKNRDKFKKEAAIPFDQIRPGDRVTILTPHNQQVTGSVVMKGPHGWVLNLGGRHGTPGIATPDNVVKVTKGRRAADDEKESRYEEGKPADPTENMSPEDAKKWKENTEEHKDKFKSADWKTAKLQKRQESILKKYLDTAGSRAVMFFDELPSKVQDDLRRVKDQETLHMDVDRWLGDNNNPHLRTGW